MREKLVLFGAGNIGRSFIGQLFARSGYEVVFVDIDSGLVGALNREGRYRVVIKRNDERDEVMWVEGVRAVNASDGQAVGAEIATASIAATAVGAAALRAIAPLIARSIERRFTSADAPMLDIIIAENIREGAGVLRAEVEKHLPESSRALLDRVGLVETSIGKMVPIMTRADRAVDPLWVFAEEYNTLIVDGRAFRGAPPSIQGLDVVDNISAYVDRKLYIHNLGHAAVAYLGNRRMERAVYLWEALENESVSREARRAMEQSAAALSRAYPREFPPGTLLPHIDDLLRRFANRALADTIFRVGRDLYRKLGRNERLIGAALLAARHGVPFDAIALVIANAVQFRAADEEGKPFPDDRRFTEEELPRGMAGILERVCGLRPSEEPDRQVYDDLLLRAARL